MRALLSAALSQSFARSSSKQGLKSCRLHRKSTKNGAAELQRDLRDEDPSSPALRPLFREIVDDYTAHLKTKKSTGSCSSSLRVSKSARIQSA